MKASSNKYREAKSHKVMIEDSKAISRDEMAGRGSARVEPQMFEPLTSSIAWRCGCDIREPSGLSYEICRAKINASTSSSLCFRFLQVVVT